MRVVRKNLTFGMALLLLVGLVPVMSGCGDESATAAPTAPLPPSVTVSAPEQRAVSSYAEYTGLTEAAEVVEIRARVEGDLAAIHFEPGQMVEEGDLLFTIDDATYRARLKEARANLSLRAAEKNRSETRAGRMEKLREVDAISEMDDIDANTEMVTARASVAAAAAAVERAELDLSYTQITAPISGRISDSRVDPGNLVGAGERTLLTTIVQDESIQVSFSVSERDLLQYLEQTGSGPSPATERTPVFMGLSSQSDYPYEGYIDFIENQVDAASGTIRVRASFPNTDHRLMSGLYARVRIPIGAKTEALLVPDTAVGKDQQGRYLFTVNAENVVQYQPVVTGAQVGGMRIITQGLVATDRVIINGLQRARPGQPITPVAPETEKVPDQQG